MTTPATPLWVQGAISRDFLADPRRMCVGKRDLYFDDSIDALAACQALCFQCPVFQACTRWTLGNYRDLPFGTFAGLNENLRARLAAGTEEYYDWRQGYNRRNHVRRKADEISRALWKNGRGKSSQKKLEMPPCVNCGLPDAVSRYGRDRDTNRQRYQCGACRIRFLGEEL